MVDIKEARTGKAIVDLVLAFTGVHDVQREGVAKQTEEADEVGEDAIGKVLDSGDVHDAGCGGNGDEIGCSEVELEIQKGAKDSQ